MTVPPSPPPPTDGQSHTKRIFGRHRAWAVDATEREELPVGWIPLVEDLFASITTAMKGSRDDRLVVGRVGVTAGALVVEVTPGARTATRRLDAVRLLVEQARLRSLTTCETCGEVGQLRVGQGSVTLCDLHAAERSAGGRRAAPPRVAVDPRRSATAVLTGRPTSRVCGGIPAGRPSPDAFALYDLADVAAALGRRHGRPGPGAHLAHFCGDPDDGPAPEPDTEHAAYLRGILREGEAGRWRTLTEPDPACLANLLDLHARAPHMAAVTELVRRHLAAALAIGLPVSMPPVMLLGEPGGGKTWYLSRLAKLLCVPFRRYPMSGQSLADGLCGAHPVWRNAQPGLAAKTLLAERVANPVLFVDELDKASAHNQEDPYRAFYDLLEPEGARAFRDEYLQFPIDASHVIWVAAGNDVGSLPDPILDRLTVVVVPVPDEAQTRAIAVSVYDDLNVARRRFFPSSLDEAALDRLVGMGARTIRKVLAEAMTRAAADGRRRVRPDDVVADGPRRRRIGFR